jgi:dTDP-4-amino-4,6-dideoxygalactose transaminase
MNRFPFFDLTRQYTQIKSEVMTKVTEVFDKQAFVMGDEVTKLESELSEYIGVKHSITCSSGTDALVLALKALDIGSGDEVITTPFSFFASTSSILLAGGTPTFGDIDPDTFCLDSKSLEKVLTKKTKAIMPVHLFGQCADMEAINSFAEKHSIPVIEDFAQALGSKFKNQSAGNMGFVGATSFYPTKNLGGAGEGGLVTTNDDRTAEKLKLLRVHGMKVRYTHDLLGWNSRLDGLQAAVLRIKLRHLDKWVARRQTLAKQYSLLLAEIAEAGLIKLPEIAKERVHVWNQYVIQVSNRDAVRKSLDEKGIPTDIFYPKTIPAQPVMQELGFRELDIPHSINAAKGAIALPIFPELTDGEQKEVASALIEVLKTLSVPFSAGIPRSL